MSSHATGGPTQDVGSCELELWAISVGASTWMVDLQPHEVVRVAGIVQRLRIDPVDGVLQASVCDGTGRVAARWHLRRPTPELVAVPGRRVILTGPTAVRDGICVMDEPDVVVVDPEPETTQP